MMLGEEPKHAGGAAELPHQVKADACHAAATRYAHHLARMALLEMDWRRASAAGATGGRWAGAASGGGGDCWRGRSGCCSGRRGGTGMQLGSRVPRVHVHEVHGTAVPNACMAY